MTRNGCDGDRPVEGVRSGFVERPSIGWSQTPTPSRVHEESLGGKKKNTSLVLTVYSHTVHRGVFV